MKRRCTRATCLTFPINIGSIHFNNIFNVQLYKYKYKSYDSNL